MLHNWKGRIAEEVDVGALELHLASPSSPAVAIPVWMGSSPARASGWRDVRRWRRRKRVEKGGREGGGGWMAEDWTSLVAVSRGGER